MILDWTFFCFPSWSLVLDEGDPPEPGSWLGFVTPHFLPKRTVLEVSSIGFDMDLGISIPRREKDHCFWGDGRQFLIDIDSTLGRKQGDEWLAGA